MGGDFGALLKPLLIPVMIAVMGGFARFAFSEKRTLGDFIRGVIIAAFVGVMVSLGLENTFLSDSLKGMIVGVSSFCADEVVVFILACVKEMGKDPLRYLASILDAVRGNAIKKSDDEK